MTNPAPQQRTERPPIAFSFFPNPEAYRSAPNDAIHDAADGLYAVADLLNFYDNGAELDAVSDLPERTRKGLCLILNAIRSVLDDAHQIMEVSAALHYRNGREAARREAVEDIGAAKETADSLAREVVELRKRVGQPRRAGAKA